MDQTNLRKKQIEALQLFNKVLVTSKIYPKGSSQLVDILDKGYVGIKKFIRHHGCFQLSVKNSIPMLCGHVLDEDTLGGFSAIVIFERLQALGLQNFVLRQDSDRFSFGQIVETFNVSINKIQEIGGGLNYVSELGLSTFFPTDKELQELQKRNICLEGSEPKKLIKIDAEILESLLGRNQKPAVLKELKQRFISVDSSADLLGAGVANILSELQKKKEIVAVDDFQVMLERAELYVNQRKQKLVAMELGKLLTDNLKPQALCVLFCQDYSGNFGSLVFDGLLTFLDNEKFGNIVIIFREQIAKARLLGGDSSERVHFFGRPIKDIIESERGKYFLNTEQAKSTIRSGETKRRRQRFESSLKGLLAGRKEVLQSVEFISYLPEAVRKLKQKGDVKSSGPLVSALGAELSKTDSERRDVILNSLVSIGEQVLESHSIALVDKYLDQVIETVVKFNIQERLFNDIVQFLHKLMIQSWHRKEYERGDKVLSLLYQIRSGRIIKSSSAKTIISKIQDNNIDRRLLPEFLSECLANPKDEQCTQRLILQGPVALRFLVESLIDAEQTAARVKIIDMLTYGDKHLLPIIVERLQGHMPWYGKRNLIKLLGEVGEEENAESLMPYLKHEDYRIQREAFLTLYRIGGKNRKQLLLLALRSSSEIITLQIIEGLGSMADQEIVPALNEILRDYDHFSKKIRNDLLIRTLDALGRCKCQEAIKCIEDFRKQGPRIGRSIPKSVWDSADRATAHLQKDIQEIRRKHIQANQIRKNAIRQVAKIKQGAVPGVLAYDSRDEQKIRSLLNQGNRKAALSQLIELIEVVARKRNFIQADKLKEWLLEIEPQGIAINLRAAEVIEQEKRAAIGQDHIEIWSKLYDKLNTKEFAALHGVLSAKQFKSDEIIISNGSLKSCLYFINTGKVKLILNEAEQEIVAKTLGKGEIFGASTFFESSVWTITVASVGPAQISVLDRQDFQKLLDSYPEIEEKLQGFCKNFERIEGFLKIESRERRQHERFNIEGMVTALLKDGAGGRSGLELHGNFIDVSRGGLTFLHTIPGDDDARYLLGRQVEISIPNMDDQDSINGCIGTIVALRKTGDVANMFSAHVKFESVLEEEDFQVSLNSLNDQ